MLRRFLSFALTLLLLFMLVGCTGTLPQSTSASTRTVVDMLDRRVEIPARVESAAVIYGVATNLMLPLGLADRLVAINATWGILGEVEPALKELPTVGQGSVDLEKLAQINPDVFIHRGNDQRTIDAVSGLGIPVVAIQPETTEQILETYLLLGNVFSVEERAQQVVNYYNDKVQFAKDLVAEIPQEKRPTAIMMGSELGKVAGGDMLQSAMIEAAGGVNMAADIRTGQTWPMVGTEQIFSWDPDFIFCTNGKSSDYTPESLLQDPVWDEMTAIENNRIYKMPSEVDSWEFPGLATSLGFLWMLHQMYPELYGEEAFLAEVDAYYEFAYGKTFEREFLGY